MAKKSRWKICGVCREPQRYGPHKHRHMYCGVCKKRTIHVTAFFGSPWDCVNYHPGDGGFCSGCGKKLMPEVVRVAKVLGASKILCAECTKNHLR